MKTILCSCVFLLILNCADGQVTTNFNNSELITSRGKFDKDFRPRNPRVIPARDIKLLLEKEELENKSGEAKPFRIAEAIDVDIDIVKEADWIEEGENAFGKFSIVAVGAKSISVNFDQFRLPIGTELYVYNQNGEMITGPVTENENNENNFWGTWVYKGGHLTVDLTTPSSTKANLRLNVSSVAYGYKELYSDGFGQSAPCNINVLCQQGFGWENERNAVASILNGSSTSFCSGALINNTCNLNIPYLLTANHCFDGSPANWKFQFRAWSAACTPSQNSNGVTFNGSTLRARSAGSDFCLVELNQVPQLTNLNITFAGWSRQNIAPPSGASITHPRGDVMKIAIYNTPPTQEPLFGSNDWNVEWAEGTVEQRSSGGPLFNNNHQIIGQVHGGDPADVCTANDHAFFGRFDLSWTGGGTNATRLSNWLDPGGTGALAINSRVFTTINGPTLICTTGTFTLQNQTPGSTVAWSSSNPAILSINPATGVATKQANWGQVTITASLLSPGACTAAMFTRTTHGGVPSANTNTLIFPSGQRGVNPVSLSANRNYNFNVDFVHGATSYTWVLPSGFSFVSGSTTSNPVIRTSSTNGTYTLNCRANNTCGWNWTHDLAINVGGGGQQQIAAYPNPASSNLTIEPTSSSLTISDNDVAEEINTSLSFSARLLNQFNSTLLLGESKNGRIVFDVSAIQNGIYYLQIARGQELITKQIVLSK